MKRVMGAAVLLLWVAAGCQDKEHFPPGETGAPGGGGAGGATRIDASTGIDSGLPDAGFSSDSGVSGDIGVVEQDGTAAIAFYVVGNQGVAGAEITAPAGALHVQVPARLEVP